MTTNPAAEALSDEQINAMWKKHCKDNSVSGLTVIKPAAFARAVIAADRAARKPLTDAQIDRFIFELEVFARPPRDWAVAAIRAIERAHNILATQPGAKQ